MEWAEVGTRVTQAWQLVHVSEDAWSGAWALEIRTGDFGNGALVREELALRGHRREKLGKAA